MKLLENDIYIDEIDYLSKLDLEWQRFKDKCILVTGARGLIGSCFIDVIMNKNRFGLGCSIIAVGRNVENLKERFNYCMNSELITFIEADIGLPINADNIPNKIDYILHLASNTHPVVYSTDPIGTITTNVIGTDNLLRLAIQKHTNRFLFASSNEIYGENRGDVELFDENYCGYIDSNTLRAGYPESKRCGEALCQAYRKKYGIDVVIARFTRAYGPTMLLNDTKAINQFILRALNNEDVILKSDGKQIYTYIHVSDAVAGLLYVLLKGENGEAYNVADGKFDIPLREIAYIIAKKVGVTVSFDLPEKDEKEGFSVVKKARLNGDKLLSLGWKPKYYLDNGIVNTMDILKQIVGTNEQDRK